MDALGFSIDCHKCGFSGTDEMRDASKPETCTTQQIKKIKYIKAKGKIFNQGDEATGMYNLISGIVLITMVNSRGGIFAPRLITPGCAFGYRSSLEDGHHTTTAIALRDTCYCHISQDEAQKMIDQNKDVRKALTNTCMQDIFSGREDIIMYANMNLSERLLHFMVTKLLDLFGSVAEDGSATIQLPLKRSELALVLGVQGETLSRSILRLKKSGLAFFKNTTVTIPSLRKVEDHIDIKILAAE